MAMYPIDHFTSLHFSGPRMPLGGHLVGNMGSTCTGGGTEVFRFFRCYMWGKGKGKFRRPLTYCHFSNLDADLDLIL